MVNVNRRKKMEERLCFRQSVLEEMQKAYLALIGGGVQSYTIGSRSLSKFDLPKLAEEIRQLEQEIDELENMLAGGARRKFVGVVPRGW